MTVKSLPKLKIAFSDFWHAFDPERNFFSDLLRSRYQLEVSDRPDVLICSTFGQTWRDYSCPRFFFTGENLVADPRHFDASLTFAPTEGTNYYLPLYRLYGSYPLAFQPRTLTEADWARKQGIGMVFSNLQSKFRTWSFHALDRTFGVGSGGRAFNNVGGPVKDKGAFLANYRISVAFENTSWEGYTTEKLIEAYAFGTIPLYWGDPLVGTRFNDRAFVTIRDKRDFPRLVEEVRLLLTDFDAYRARFEQPLFPNNEEPAFLTSEAITDFLEASIERGFTRKQRGRVTDYHVHRWHRLWKYREWSPKMRPVIWMLRRVEWVSYLGGGVKAFVKRVIGKGF